MNVTAIDDLNGKLGELQGAVDDASAEHAALAAAADAAEAPVIVKTPRTIRSEHASLAVGALGIVSIVTLVLTNHPIPDVLNIATLTSLGIGGALATGGKPA